MSYTKHHALEACIASICILGIAAIFMSVSGKYDPAVVEAFDAPETQIEVSQVKPLRIPLPHDDKPIAGVIVYAANEATAGATFNARIEDNRGNILVKKRLQRVVYSQNNRPAIHVLFHEKKFSQKEQVFLLITPSTNDSYTFIGTPGQALVYSLLYKEPVSSAAKQGIYIGTALALSIVLLYYARVQIKWQWIGAALIICIFSLLSTLPYIFRPGDWGIYDWDYRHSLSHIYQTTIREYHQFPLWNPYICGGTAALGDPEFAVLTPSFVLQFIFGVENGTGVALSFVYIITGIGMLFLARRIGLDPFPALVSSFVMLFSSSLMLKATEGHTTIIFAFMWVPWALWAWIAAYRADTKHTKKWILLCGLFLTFALLQGGIYVLSYTAVALGALSLLVRNKKSSLKISFYSYILMVGLGSFQLIPSLLWVKEFPDQAFVGSGYTFMNLWDIFFGRYLQNVYIIPDQLSRWHEYGAYIGYGVFALVLLGASYVKSSRIVRILLFGILTTLIVSSLGPLFEPVLGYMKFLPRSNISRLVLFTTLSAALLAGFGMKRILLLKSSYAPVISLIVIGFIAIDLLSLTYPIAEEGFGISRVTENIPKSPLPITYTDETFNVRHIGNDMPRAYAATLKGYGTFSFCSVIGPNSAVIQLSDVNNPPDFMQPTHGVQTELISWTPNSISFTYTSSQDSDISINTNYASGWRVNVGSIVQKNQRLTVHVPAGENTVNLSYTPPGLWVGLVITLLTLLYAAVQLKHLRR
ncbi:MAG: YfhO family protein [bacterium]|nr:YfhO family protein [bacterium]